MKEYFCLNVTEAVAEVEACKTYVAECQVVPVNRANLSLAKAALRAAERELKAWEAGIVPPFQWQVDGFKSEAEYLESLRSAMVAAA
jgi:hypothetical protein